MVTNVLIGVDLLRKELNSLSGIAIIFVVLIHINAQNQWAYKYPFFIEVIMNTIFCAVPIFVFIAGFKYSMHESKYNFMNFAKRKINKVGKPFLIISSAIIIYNLVASGTSITYPIIIIVLKQFLYIFIGKNPAYQLWYIPMYLFVTLMYPLIKKCIPNIKVRLILFIIFYISSIILFNWTILSPQMIDKLTPIRFSFYFLFYELGGIVYRNEQVLKKFYIIILNLIIVIIFFISFKSNPMLNLKLRDLISPSLVLIYYYLSYLLKDSKLLQVLGRYSFYIFLFHVPFFLDYTIVIFLKKHDLINRILSVPIILIFSIGCSMLFYKVIEKTSIKKYIL